MNISSLIPSLPGIGNSTASTASTTAANSAASAAAAADGSTQPCSSAAMRDVLRHYDMTDISPNEFSQMVQKLYNSGAISQKDLQSLSGVRADLDSSGVPPDTSINLVDFYQNRLQQATAQNNGKPANTAQTQAIVGKLSWVEKFSAIHDQPASASINTTA